MWGTRLSLERRHRHRHRLAKTRGSHPGQQAWTALESAQACASRSSVALRHHRRSATSLRPERSRFNGIFPYVLEVNNNQIKGVLQFLGNVLAGSRTLLPILARPSAGCGGQVRGNKQSLWR